MRERAVMIYPVARLGDCSSLCPKTAYLAYFSTKIGSKKPELARKSAYLASKNPLFNTKKCYLKGKIPI